jgi:hypothetical protein
MNSAHGNVKIAIVPYQTSTQKMSFCSSPAHRLFSRRELDVDAGDRAVF